MSRIGTYSKGVLFEGALNRGLWYIFSRWGRSKIICKQYAFVIVIQKTKTNKTKVKQVYIGPRKVSLTILLVKKIVDKKIFGGQNIVWSKEIFG